jgi:xanthine/CO dehydrogenase XdhC/CoxF family maturation factor
VAAAWSDRFELTDILSGGEPRNLHLALPTTIWDVGLACGGTIDVCQLLEPDLVAAFRASGARYCIRSGHHRRNRCAPRRQGAQHWAELR